MKQLFSVLAMTTALGLSASDLVAAPTATGAGRPLLEDTTAIFIPWVNDADPSDTFTFSHVHQPADGNGTASEIDSHQELQYVPTVGVTGPDSFTYRATDQGGDFVAGTARLRVYDASAHSRCTRLSTVNSDGTIATRTFSNDCTFYTSRQTRVAADGTAVTMDYFVNWPPFTNTPRAVVVLIGGGDLDMNFSGDTTTGVPDESGGGNFVVRTAQLFADAGYLTIAINKPSDQPPAGVDVTDPVAVETAADQYRITVQHAVDILRVVKHVNTLGLPLFLAGTSKGALSAVAANLIATGVSLSSPVTNDKDQNGNSHSSYLFVGPSSPTDQLNSSSVQRPAHVLWNTSDLCPAAPPAGSQALASSLTAAVSNTVTGGLRVTQVGNGLTSDDIGGCQGYDYHGYFGIESAAVNAITTWLGDRVQALGDTPLPQAPFKTLQTAAGVAKHTNLANLTGNGSGVSYALSHGTTSLGGTVTISGAQVTYTPPSGASNQTDYYVYVVTNSSGGVAAGIITVNIGS